MKFINFALLGALLLFYGCAKEGINLQKEEPLWTPYIKENGAKSEILLAFDTKFIPNNTKNIPTIGNAYTKDIKSQSKEKLGHIYLLARAKGNVIINLDTNSTLDINLEKDKAALQNSSSFKFYEFSSGLIESIVFKSDKQGVCLNFLSNKFINITSATNYYLGDDGFFATILEMSVLKDRGAKIKNLSFFYDFNDDAKEKEARNFTASEKFKFLLSQDIKKQARILSTLCAI
ncbi:hypothetical protein CCAL12920_06325 [Campylobacter sp. RM12920]|uniref:DUF8095 domain-containing protein n=1 Tax=Campylobacter californiensis TaxID=1032243 RepID=A0ABD4JJA1_9BACT|nr:hypothetical protein [Campylobacter sp. RM9328]MBE2986823.1 hypothetical protein [Campylobacter sp. RM12919]MBE2988499.1 hypothetical protein [Campylobacter sp. RM12920]